MYNLSFLAAFFLISLQSLYFPQVGLALYSISGVLLLCGITFVLICAFNVRGKILDTYFCLLCIPPFLYINSVIPVLSHGDISASRIISLLMAMMCIVAYAAMSRLFDPISMLIKIVILHSIVFLSQFVLYYVFRVDFDPVALLSPTYQRGWGGSLEHSTLGIFRRFGGLYSEPGTYGVFIGPIVALLSYAATTGATYKGLFFAISLGLATLFLTFSLFSWIFVTIICCAIFSRYWYFVFVIALISPVIYLLAEPYLTYRFGGGVEAGVDFRFEIILNVLDFVSLSFMNFFSGSGLVSDYVPFKFSGAINDASILIYTLMTSGVLGLLIYILMIAQVSLRAGFAIVPFFIILFMSKISPTMPFFWLLLCFSVHLSILGRTDKMTLPQERVLKEYA